jgi:putative ATP-dependent endonuclease of OLD family
MTTLIVDDAAEPATPTVELPTPAFGIRVARVRVHGFRMLVEVDVDLDPGTTVLLGENNTGKSAFLAALDIAFGRSRPVAEDLHRSPMLTSPKLQVDVCFQPVEGTSFDDEVVNALAEAIEIGAGTGALDSFAIRFEAAREDGKNDLKTQSVFLQGWGPTAVPKAQPPVTNDIRKRLSFDFLDAQRDVVTQLRNRRTTWGDVATLSDVTSTDRESLEAELRTLNDKVTDKSALLTRVRSDLSDLGNTLGTGNVDVAIDTLPRRLDDLVKSMDITVTAADAQAFGAAAQGMGTRSLAALLVFRSAVNSARMPAGISSTGAARLSAFEEPEAHLHPHAQRSVFKTIDAVAGQKLVTTHSTQLVSTAPPPSFRSFRRVGPSTFVTSAAGYPASDVDTVKRLFIHRHPDALFAKVVGLVEGDSDHLLMRHLADVWWPGGPETVGVSIVSCDGVHSILAFAPFLSCVGIPWCFLRDGDGAGEKAESNLIKKLRLVLQTPEGSEPPAQIVRFDGLIEDSFLDLGAALVDGVLQNHSSGPLTAYVARNDGTERAKTQEEERTLPREAKVFRDYKGVDGEARARRDLLLKDKVETARLFGAHLATMSPIAWPIRLREFLKQLDSLAGRPERVL